MSLVKTSKLDESMILSYANKNKLSTIRSFNYLGLGTLNIPEGTIIFKTKEHAAFIETFNFSPRNRTLQINIVNDHSSVTSEDIKYLFDYFSVLKISSFVEKDSAQDLLLKRLNFKSEVLHNKHRYIDGKYVSFVEMGILKLELE